MGSTAWSVRQANAADRRRSHGARRPSGSDAHLPALPAAMFKDGLHRSPASLLPSYLLYGTLARLVGFVLQHRSRVRFCHPTADHRVGVIASQADARRYTDYLAEPFCAALLALLASAQPCRRRGRCCLCEQRLLEKQRPPCLLIWKQPTVSVQVLVQVRARTCTNSTVQYKNTTDGTVKYSYEYVVYVTVTDRQTDVLKDRKTERQTGSWTAERRSGQSRQLEAGDGGGRIF